MAKIPKNLSDKSMFNGYKEDVTFENTWLDSEEINHVPRKKTAEKQDLSTSLVTPELQEKIGKALLELKLELYKEGLVEYNIKVTRNGKEIVLSAVPLKKKKLYK